MNHRRARFNKKNLQYLLVVLVVLEEVSVHAGFSATGKFFYLWFTCGLPVGLVQICSPMATFHWHYPTALTKHQPCMVQRLLNDFGFAYHGAATLGPGEPKRPVFRLLPG
jgi:hypothetical protein